MTAVNVFALVLLVEAMVGAVFSVFDVHDAWHERRRLQQSHRQSGLLWVTAHGNLRTAIFTFGMFLCILLAMAAALMLEPGDDVRVIVGRIGVFGAMTLLMLKRVYDRLDRRQIRKVQHGTTIEVVPGSDLAVLGGPMAIDHLVVGLYATLVRDELLRHHFRGMQVSRLIQAQADWLTRHLAGKPSTVDLAVAHAHLRIAPAEFDRFMRIVRATLVDFNVPADLAAQLASIMSDTRDQIVTRTQ